MDRPTEPLLDDRLATAQALIEAARNKDDEGIALLLTRIPAGELDGVILILAHIAGRPD